PGHPGPVDFHHEMGQPPQPGKSHSEARSGRDLSRFVPTRFCGLASHLSFLARVGPTQPTRATARTRKERRGNPPKLTHVGQPRTMVVNAALASSLDRDEEPDPCLHDSSMERDTKFSAGTRKHAVKRRPEEGQKTSLDFTLVEEVV